LYYAPQDAEKEAGLPLKEVSVDDILDAQRREQEAKQDQDKLVSRALKDRGLNVTAEMSHDDMF
jgi:U6 snRNA-associated Sm-like protein LSm1